MFFPHVIEKTGRSSKSFDLPTKLLEERIIYFLGEVDEFTANSTIMQLLWLNSIDQTKPITMYINSPGGSVYQGLAIFDVINKLECKVNTICIGNASSMGAFLLSAGTGTRKASENARVMIHSVAGGQQGTYHDVKPDFKEMELLQHKLIDYITDFTKGKSTKEFITEKTERDYWMSAQEALDVGLIDEIM